MTYCENEYCDFEAVKAVPVSVNSYGDQTRSYCTPCENAYTIGAQHATYRAASQIADYITNVLEIPAIEDCQPTLALFTDSDDVDDRRCEAQQELDAGRDDEDGG